MMAKQAELKKQAYDGGLKSRALSVLIYLIDRSDRELTCFPAIPTMAGQLHISESTVKRALRELVETGYIKKDSRFRENNRGQTSNLYTLVLFCSQSAHNDDANNPDAGDEIETAVPATETAQENKVEHISFRTLKKEKETKVTQEEGVLCGVGMWCCLEGAV